MSDKIVQGNRTFLRLNENYWFLYKIGDERYSGKSYQYYPCRECGQLICNMMGGAARHYKMHQKNKLNK